MSDRQRPIIAATILLLLLIQAMTDVAAVLAAADARDPLSTPGTRTLTWPARQLRGYGTVSGTFVADDDGSITRIACDDAGKAALLQAKFLSDLALQGGTTARMEGDPALTVQMIDSQGCLTASCSGSSVVIVAARDLKRLHAALARAAVSGATTPQVAVPMYLDRWDRFGFRHYYWPWQQPPGYHGPGYDAVSEFDYAQAQARAGILIPISGLATDSADGMVNSGWGGWVEQEAARHGLPVDIHLGANAGYEPTWLLNRFRAQTQLKMPGFTGNFHDLLSPYLGGQGVMSWNATTGEDAELGVLQTQVRRTAKAGNVISYLEPHGETRHGAQDLLLEYGPVADAAYRRYLRGRYTTVAAIAARWQRDVPSFDAIHMPELASFAGLVPEALDVAGRWRVGYEELTSPSTATYQYDAFHALPSTPAPEAWYKPGFDDSSWPEVAGGGSDKQLFLAKRPAVFRRTFEVPAAWRARHPRAWLSVWDLTQAQHSAIRVVLNGQEIGVGTLTQATPHWFSVDATAALKDGRNSLAIRLPQGAMAYRTYLTPVEPLQDPYLGEGLNAQWVDFIDFTSWSRIEAIRRGMEMIRQAAPDQPITLMHPDDYADGLKSLAVAYGGEFHNTGYMAAFWADSNPALMRGADLPYSLEPGAPAKDVAEWRRFWGLWQTEGVQSVDYFIHLGDILWNPEIKADYEAHRRQITLMGQSHYAKAEVACLYSDRVAQLTGFPWGSAPNANLGSGYWQWNPAAVLRGHYPYDGLSQGSFASGDADAYRVIIDANTSIMDESQVAEIERWIRAGGTLITLAQTGRHTPEKPDSWPIARLTGYRVTHIDRLGADGRIEESGRLAPAPGQEIATAAWEGIAANGLHLERTAADAHDLLLWHDGGVAAGMRPLGKGLIVQLGAKFTGARIFDRVEPGGDSPEVRHLRDLFTALLVARGIAPEAGRVIGDAEQVWLRPAVTNNGLYDTWTLFNWSSSQKQTVAISLGKDRHPAFAIDARTSARLAIQPGKDDARIDGIALEPLETRVFLTPRGEIEHAPLSWFALQRNWWRGTTSPAPLSMPAGVGSQAYDLTPAWRFRLLDDGADAGALLATGYDDASWPASAIGIWDVAQSGGHAHAVYRKAFTVPSSWVGGRVSLWLTSWTGSSFVDRGRVLLDGREIKGDNDGAAIAEGLPSLTPGSSHQLAVDIHSRGVLAGLRGQCWLSFERPAQTAISLAGRWVPSADGLRSGEPIQLPGDYSAQFLRRTVAIDAALLGKEAVLTVEGDRSLVGVLVNGTLVRRHHHLIGERWSLAITPFVHCGGENEIELVRWGGSGSGRVREVTLGFSDPQP